MAGRARWFGAHTTSTTTTCNNTGKRIQGKVTTTISRGRLAWHDGKLDVAPGTGRLLELPPFGPLFDGLHPRRPAATAARLVAEFAARNGPTPVPRDGELTASSRSTAHVDDRQEL